MTIGKASDFQIYQEQVNGGFVETLVQNTDAFNSASRNAIRMVTNRLRGDYDQESFFQDISNMVTRRDTTSVSSAADLALAQDELISVKLARKIGPVAQTLDAFRKVLRPGNETSLSFLLGTQAAKGRSVEALNTALTSLVAGIGAQSDLLHSGGSTLVTTDLVRGLSKFGDAASNIIMWVMHSKPFFDLVESQITANIDGVSNFVVAQASPVTLNRPVLVTDSTDLIASNSPDNKYYTLGLVQDAAIITDSEEEFIHAEIVSGLENLVVRLQAEYAYNLGLKGIKWDTTNGGANPSDSALGTGSNWDKVMGDVKNLPGVRIETD